MTWYEYPLFDQEDKCPTARYVGGTSKYLCECKKPQECLGWIASKNKYNAPPSKMG